MDGRRRTEPECDGKRREDESRIIETLDLPALPEEEDDTTRTKQQQGHDEEEEEKEEEDDAEEEEACATIVSFNLLLLLLSLLFTLHSSALSREKELKLRDLSRRRC